METLEQQPSSHPSGAAVAKSSTHTLSAKAEPFQPTSRPASANSGVKAAPGLGRVVLCSENTRPIVDVRFQICTDFKNQILLISASHDRRPALRWGDNGDYIGAFVGHAGAVWSAGLNHRGSLAATGSADFTVKLWDVTTGAEVNTLTHAHVVKAVDFSESDQWLLTAGNDKTAKVFDLGSGGAEAVSTWSHDSAVHKAVWTSPTAFITGSANGVLRLLDTRAPTAAVRELALPAGKSAGFNPMAASSAAGKKAFAVTDLSVLDSKRVCAAAGSTVSLVEMSDLRLLESKSLAFDVEAVTLSPDGTRLAAGGSDLWLHIYDTSESFESSAELYTFKGHSGPIFCARFHPDGKSVASGSEDGVVRLWGLAEVEEKRGLAAQAAA